MYAYGQTYAYIIVRMTHLGTHTHTHHTCTHSLYSTAVCLLQLVTKKPQKVRPDTETSTHGAVAKIALSLGKLWQLYSTKQKHPLIVSLVDNEHSKSVTTVVWVGMHKINHVIIFMGWDTAIVQSLYSNILLLLFLCFLFLLQPLSTYM